MSEVNKLADVLKPVAPVRNEPGKKEIVITMIDGQRPVVTFDGFWNGKLLLAAINSISKAYRLRARDIVRPRVKVEGTSTQQS